MTRPAALPCARPRRASAPRSNRQSGLSLAEVLVSLTILSLAGMVALFLYDAARKSFAKGENAAEQQQSVRIAFDRLSSDVRLAGYNANPDGDPFRDDEGIEAAYDTAIVVRADFDHDDPDGVGEDENNEAALAGGAHPVESIGNDEIVAYVLAKPDGSSPGTLTFDADVKDVPRDGVVETVRIPNVALVQDSPPYTLYRITLNRSAGTWGGSDFFHRTPLLENVRSLTFRYFDAAGPVNPAFDLSSTNEDIGGADTDAARRARAGIRRVEISIDGLTRDPDLTWEDPADPNPATRRFRKFHLAGEVTPRNLGRKGQQDLGWDTTPPSRPGAPTLVSGHCQGLLVQWPPNPDSDRVSGYRIRWRSTDGRPPGARTVASQSAYISGLQNSTTYYVSVQAVDAAGNWSAPSEERSEATRNDNSPEAPGNIVAGRDADYGIRLTWNAVDRNTDSQPAADVRTPTNMIRDLEGYRVLRGLAIDFPPLCPPPPGLACSPNTVIAANETVTGVMAQPVWFDRTAVACRHYFYRVLAWDLCDSNNDSGYEAEGWWNAPAAPAKPSGLTGTSSSGTVHLAWDPVAVDTEGGEIFIDRYEVERCEGGGACANLPVEGAGTGYDDVTPGISPTYRVRARNDCTSAARYSEWSEPIQATCAFSGRVEISSPASGWIAGRTTVTVRVASGSDTYTGASLTIRRTSDASDVSVPLAGAGPTWTYVWTPPAAGGYTLQAAVTNSSACVAAGSARVFVGQ